MTIPDIHAQCDKLIHSSIRGPKTGVRAAKALKIALDALKDYLPIAEGCECHLCSKLRHSLAAIQKEFEP